MLAKMQRAAALCISSALRTTPNEALNVILNPPSPELAGMEQAKVAAIRLRDTKQWNTQEASNLCILKVIQIVPSRTDYSTPTEYIQTPFNIIIPERDDWNSRTPGPQNAICFYTGGSKLQNRVGGGLYFEQLGLRISFRLPDNCSVFQAEVAAIREALKHLKALKPESSHVSIFSDSQAAIKSIASISSHSKTVSNCRSSLHEMTQQFVISLIWVPGHRDIEGNSIADELAREGTFAESGATSPRVCLQEVREEPQKKTSPSKTDNFIDTSDTIPTTRIISAGVRRIYRHTPGMFRDVRQNVSEPFGNLCADFVRPLPKIQVPLTLMMTTQKTPSATIPSHAPDF
ncbi:uncharacterized protein LOC122319487 [Drosophila yakuba]|uniref:uncharacterized protein LOC122319487 n=1 Tax=Drosophila yakuba TaxID=7245 RepID=UPI001C8A15AA|nr:uncharacterized protein LOC122319487 [Drosophila yakuba]